MQTVTISLQRQLTINATYTRVQTNTHTYGLSQVSPQRQLEAGHSISA